MTYKAATEYQLIIHEQLGFHAYPIPSTVIDTLKEWFVNYPKYKQEVLRAEKSARDFCQALPIIYYHLTKIKFYDKME